MASESEDPTMKNAMTIPGKTECDIASPIIDIFLSTRKQPSKAQQMETSDPVNMIMNASIIEQEWLIDEDL